MSVLTYTRRAKQTIDAFASTLSDGSRIAGDYDNSSNEDTFCDVYLDLEFNTSAPSANTRVGTLWVLFGDGEATESFPEGGDGTDGNDDDPQALLQVGQFETINPSTTVIETLCIPGVPLRPTTCRFVMKNISGQTIENTSEIYIIPYKADVS